MSKKFFKIITLCLVALMALTVLTACNNKGGEENSKCEHTFENYTCTKCGEDYYSATLSFADNEFNDGYKVTGVGSATDIETLRIPKTHNGKPITAIASRAFYNNKDIKEVIIPDGVKRIGENAFEKCTNLTKIRVPSTITEVGENAFLGCIRLEYNSLGNVKYLGNEENLFYYLASVKNYSVSTIDIDVRCRLINHEIFERMENLQYTEKDGFSYLGSLVNQYLYLAKVSDAKIENVNINFNCSIVNPKAITDCVNRKTFTVDVGNGYFKEDGNCLIDTVTNTVIAGAENSVIPSYVTAIGDYAFASVKGLTQITIPNSVKEIGNGAFSNCKGLTSVNIPASVLKIGENAFNGCVNLETINCAVKERPNGWNEGWIGEESQQTVPVWAK